MKYIRYVFKLSFAVVNAFVYESEWYYLSLGRMSVDLLTWCFIFCQCCAGVLYVYEPHHTHIYVHPPRLALCTDITRSNWSLENACCFWQDWPELQANRNDFVCREVSKLKMSHLYVLCTHILDMYGTPLSSVVFEPSKGVVSSLDYIASTCKRIFSWVRTQLRALVQFQQWRHEKFSCVEKQTTPLWWSPSPANQCQHCIFFTVFYISSPNSSQVRYLDDDLKIAIHRHLIWAWCQNENTQWNISQSWVKLLDFSPKIKKSPRLQSSWCKSPKSPKS